MPAESGRASDAARRDEFHIKPLVAGAGRYEQLLAARRRGSKPAQTLALPSFVGSSALALAAAAGSWPPEDSTVAESDLFAEVEAPAFAEPATLEDESEP